MDTFNSLFEMPLTAAFVLATAFFKLSILYSRCLSSSSGMDTSMSDINTFNSLFEMRGGRRRGKAEVADSFQFSIRDARRGGASAGRRSRYFQFSIRDAEIRDRYDLLKQYIETFNSLFEMRRLPNAGARHATSSFNSLFEMQNSGSS